MRLQRGVPVAGIEPASARDLARQYHGGWRSAAWAADRLGLPAEDLLLMLRALEAEGFLESQVATFPVREEQWVTTVKGGALTMGSFLKPISRARVDELLRGVLERASAYNADVAKPLVISEIRAFGSYLNPDASELGDLDLWVTIEHRTPDKPLADELTAYADRSGRRFSTFLDRLDWAAREAKQILRNRSGYINVHTEDVSRFTDH